MTPNPPPPLDDSTAPRTHARRAAAARLLAAPLAALAPLACSGERSSVRGDSAAAVAASIIAPTGAAYRETALRAVGRIRGRVLGEPGTAEADEPSRAVRDAGPACADSSADAPMPGLDGGLAGAVVWLRDARAGKPLPLVRRYALTNRGCRLEPHVQAAIAGGTLNIRSLDPVEHRTRLVRHGESTPVAVVPEYDEGQVVPNEQVLERAALVHATCELHPWSAAWIAVFDHPYFAVTTPDGAFVIDSVPPGRYRLVVWHERAGTSEREVAVTAGEVGVDVEMP